MCRSVKLKGTSLIPPLDKFGIPEFRQLALKQWDWNFKYQIGPG